MAYRSEKSFIKTFLVIIFQLSVSHQLLPKGGWAGKPKGAGSWARCRSQEPPSQAAAPAAVWFGAFRALETQSSFSRLVCAHTCRPAFNVESHHSTKQWRTQEKPSLKEKVLSEWDIPESRILFLISDWKALMNYPVSNGKHCDLCEEVLTEPLEEEEFILQVQFSDENVHLTDLTQENYVGN